LDFLYVLHGGKYYVDNYTFVDEILTEKFKNKIIPKSLQVIQMPEKYILNSIPSNVKVIYH
jgi:hypothetical protein